MGVVDLRAGTTVREYDSRSFPGQNVGFDKLVVSPDGKYVFAEGMEQLMRYAIEGDTLTFEEKSARIAQNGRAIDVSPDGSLVALPSGGGNYGAGNYTTNIYKAADLSAPEVKIASGAYPQAIGFDLKAGSIYAQNHESPLIVFNTGGVRGKSYKLAGRGRDDSTEYFAIHPDGGKFLALSNSSLRFVDTTGKTPVVQEAEAPGRGRYAAGKAANPGACARRRRRRRGREHLTSSGPLSDRARGDQAGSPGLH